MKGNRKFPIRLKNSSDIREKEKNNIKKREKKKWQTTNDGTHKPKENLLKWQTLINFLLITLKRRRRVKNKKTKKIDKVKFSWLTKFIVVVLKRQSRRHLSFSSPLHRHIRYTSSNDPIIVTRKSKKWPPLNRTKNFLFFSFFDANRYRYRSIDRLID